MCASATTKWTREAALLWSMFEQLANPQETEQLRRHLPLAANWVCQSERIIVSGTGKSRIVADRIAANLRLIGYPAFMIPATELPHGDFGAFERPGLALFVSASGRDDHVVRAAGRVLADFSMSCIAVTNAPKSPLAEICPLVLSSGADADLYGPHPPMLAFYRLSLIGDLLFNTVFELDARAHSHMIERHHR